MSNARFRRFAVAQSPGEAAVLTARALAGRRRSINSTGRSAGAPRRRRQHRGARAARARCANRQDSRVPRRSFRIARQHQLSNHGTRRARIANFLELALFRQLARQRCPAILKSPSLWLLIEYKIVDCYCLHFEGFQVRQRYGCISKSTESTTEAAH